MIKIAKYAFDSTEQVETKINSLGTATDEDGNEKVTSVLSDKWHVDVLWKNLEADEDGTIDHPYGWKSYAVDIDGDGVHSFLGLSYNAHKFSE